VITGWILAGDHSPKDDEQFLSYEHKIIGYLNISNCLNEKFEINSYLEYGCHYN